MKFYEYNVREIFTVEGIPLSEGYLALSPSEVFEAAQKLASPVVLKVQILAGGRGKAGGIRFADNPEQAKEIASELFLSKIKGFPVNKILVVRKEDIKREYYLGITINFQKRKAALVFCPEGGIEIEELAFKSPEKIIEVDIDPIIGLQNYHLAPIVRSVQHSEKIFIQLKEVIKKLYNIYKKHDCLVVEINPLALI